MEIRWYSLQLLLESYLVYGLFGFAAISNFSRVSNLGSVFSCVRRIGDFKNDLKKKKSITFPVFWIPSYSLIEM